MIHDFGEDKDEEEMFLYGAYFTHIHPISARGAFLRLNGKLERHRLIRHPLLISSVAMNSLPKADPLKRVHPGFHFTMNTGYLPRSVNSRCVTARISERGLAQNGREKSRVFNEAICFV